MIRIAVILFPGTNCEDETLRALRISGMDADLVRWNEDYTVLREYDGYVLAGGFSYEDRGRSGLVASFDPIMELVREEAHKGKVVLGICNGAQILVETGMVPGFENDRLSMCLAWNKRIKNGRVHGDWVSRWVRIKMDVPRGRSAFNDFEEDVILRVPLAHGEGRFVSSDASLLDRLIENKQTVFRYCDEQGDFVDEYPINPNGAMYNLAGICNEAGNVIAIMPHPERTNPYGGNYMNQIFLSMKRWIESHKTQKDVADIRRSKPKYSMESMPIVDFVLRVRLIITDNEEWTLDQTLKNIGFGSARLHKQVWWGITTDHADKNMVMQKVIASGELANINKEHVVGEPTSVCASDKGVSFLVQQTDDMKSASKLAHFQKHYPDLKITKIIRGVLWTVKGVDEKGAKNVLDTFLLHNPHSMSVARL